MLRDGLAGDRTYVGPEDVVGYRRQVDGGVLVGLEVYQRIVGDAFGSSLSC